MTKLSELKAIAEKTEKSFDPMVDVLTQEEDVEEYLHNITPKKVIAIIELLEFANSYLSVDGDFCDAACTPKNCYRSEWRSKFSKEFEK